MLAAFSFCRIQRSPKPNFERAIATVSSRAANANVHIAT
jgi:hypothetical protein